MCILNSPTADVIRFVREGSDALLEVDRDYQRKSGVGMLFLNFYNQLTGKAVVLIQ